MNRAAIVIFLSLAGIAGAVGLVYAGQEEVVRSAMMVEKPVVSILIAHPSMRERTLTLTGTVGPVSESFLAARVSGPILWTDDLRSGQMLRAGQVLARIDRIPFEASVAEALARVASAKEALTSEEGKRSVAVLEQSFLGGTTSALAQRQPQMASKMAELVAAEANLKKSQRNLDNTVIHAPFDGILMEESLELGAFVNTGAQVARVVASDRLRLTLPMSQGTLAGAEPEEVQVSIPGVEGYRIGEIRGFAGEVDPTTRMVNLQVDLLHPTDPTVGPVLLPGTFARAQIVLERAEAVVLPSGVIHDGFVWVEREGRLSRVPIEVLWEEGGRSVVSGLSEGARVVRESNVELTEDLVVLVTS